MWYSMNLPMSDDRLLGLNIETMLLILKTNVYVQKLTIGRVAANDDRLKSVSLILQRDLRHNHSISEISMLKVINWSGLCKNRPTVQNVRGRKKILTKVRSLMFSPSCVEVRLSITELALKSCRALLVTCVSFSGVYDLRHLSKPSLLFSYVEILFAVLAVFEL